MSLDRHIKHEYEAGAVCGDVRKTAGHGSALRTHGDCTAQRLENNQFMHPCTSRHATMQFWVFIGSDDPTLLDYQTLL